MKSSFTKIKLLLIILVVLVCANTFSYGQIPPYLPTSGLKAWYPFTGSPNDSSGYANHGTVYGSVTYGVDRHGVSGWCYFNNANGGVDIPSVNMPIGNHARSVSVWYKAIIPAPVGLKNLIAWGNNIALGQRFGIYVDIAAIGLEYRNGGVTTNYVADSVWHNLIVTYSGGGSSTVIIYKDGVSQPVTVFVPVASLNTDTEPIHCIGKLFPATSYLYCWNGSLDDIAVWDRVLTPCEAWTIAHDGIMASSDTIVGPSTLCVGASTTLTDTASGGVWSSSAPSVASVSSSGYVTGLSSGVALISYSRTYVCGTVADTHSIVVLSLPIAGTITGPASICPGTYITLTSSSSGGVWSSSAPAVATVNAITGVVGGGTFGTTIISYSVTNACGTSVDTHAVAVTSVQSAGTITGLSTVCTGATISLVGATAGGTWSSGNPAIATVASGTGTVGGVAAGSTTVTYTVINSCGTASVTQAITVGGAPNPGSITGLASVCVGDNITLNNTTTGGTWSAGSAIVTVGGASGVVGGLSAGVAIVTYSVTNSCGTATDTQAITVHSLPDAGSISAASSSVCAGTAVTLSNTVSGGSWASSNTLIATITNSSGIVTPIVPGVTTIIYTTLPDAFGCIGTSSLPFTVLSSNSFTITATVADIKCNGGNDGSIVLTTSGVGTYQFIWSNGGVSSSVSGLDAGAYTVIIKDVNANCTDTESFNILMPDVIEVKSTIRNTVCGNNNGNITLINIIGGTAPYTYLWSGGQTQPSISDLQYNSYDVVITDGNACQYRFEFVVGTDSCNVIDIHDVITPNNDGINDVWVIGNISRYPNNTVQLFDKWGDEVFYRQTYDNSWGGEGKNGGHLPDGTYFYLIKLNAPNLPESENVFSGTLLIKS